MTNKSNNGPDVVLNLTFEQAALVYAAIKETQTTAVTAMQIAHRAGDVEKAKAMVNMIELSKSTRAAIERDFEK